MNNARNAFAATVASGLLLACMLAVSIRAGMTQQSFEFVIPAEQYTAALVKFAQPLRIILTFDNLFVPAYVLGTHFFCQLLTRRGGNSTLLTLTPVLVATSGVLDLAENLHILSMLKSAELNIGLSESGIMLQSVLSAMKWHLGYVAFVLVGLSLRPQNRFEKAFAFSLLCIQIPVGILVYTAPDPESSGFFQTLRYINLLSGFLIIAWFCRRLGKTTTVVENPELVKA